MYVPYCNYRFTAHSSSTKNSIAGGGGDPRVLKIAMTVIHYNVICRPGWRELLKMNILGFACICVQN